MPTGTDRSAQNDPASRARPTSSAISPRYRGLRLTPNGPDWSTVLVAPPGRIDVRWDAMTDSVHPFHRRNATTSTMPAARVAGLDRATGSPTIAVMTRPATRGTPSARGGHIR